MAARPLISAVWWLGLGFMAATASAAEGGGKTEPEIDEKLSYSALEVSISKNTSNAERAEMAEPAEALAGFVAKKLKSQGSAFDWSPDGRYLYSSDKTVRLIEYPTFQQLRTTELRCSVSFCSRGLCVYEGRGAVAILDHETLERKLGWAFDGSPLYWQTSPASRYAICSYAPNKETLQVVNLSRGTISKPLAPLATPAIDISPYRGNLSDKLEALSFSVDGQYLFAKSRTHLFRFRIQDDVPSLDFISNIGVRTITQSTLAFSTDGRHVIVPTTSRNVRGLGDSLVVAVVPVDAPEVPDRIIDIGKGNLHQCGIDGAGNLFVVYGERLMMAPPNSEEFVPVLKLRNVYDTKLKPHPTQAGAVVYDTSLSFAMWVAPAAVKPSTPAQRWLPELGRDEQRP